MATQPRSAAVDSSSCAVQVKLNSQLEEAMLELIKKESQGMSGVGCVSQRLNARKLTVCTVFILLVSYRPIRIVGQSLGLELEVALGQYQ